MASFLLIRDSEFEQSTFTGYNNKLMPWPHPSPVHSSRERATKGGAWGVDRLAVVLGEDEELGEVDGAVDTGIADECSPSGTSASKWSYNLLIDSGTGVDNGKRTDASALCVIGGHFWLNR